MPIKDFSGSAVGTVLSGPMTNVATSFTVADATGYPTGASGPFVVVIDLGAAGEEKVLCSSRAGTTFTVTTRGYDGTVAQAHAVPAKVVHTWDAVEAKGTNTHNNDTGTLDAHPAYVKADGTRAFTAVTGIVGAPGASAVGDVAATGAATTLAASNHVHAREAFGTPGPSVPGDVAAAGAATTVARSNHVHAREAAGTPGSSAPGDVASAGTGSAIARATHVHGREAFGAGTDITTSALGDTAAAGATGKVADAGHTHGREQASASVQYINQASLAADVTGIGTTATDVGLAAPSVVRSGSVAFKRRVRLVARIDTDATRTVRFTFVSDVGVVQTADFVTNGTTGQTVVAEAIWTILAGTGSGTMKVQAQVLTAGTLNVRASASVQTYLTSEAVA